MRDKCCFENTLVFIIQRIIEKPTNLFYKFFPRKIIRNLIYKPIRIYMLFPHIFQSHLIKCRSHIRDFMPKLNYYILNSATTPFNRPVRRLLYMVDWMSIINQAVNRYLSLKRKLQYFI